MFLFRFDYWHTSPKENRKYVHDVINELSVQDNRNTIIEFGCGLGDIIGNADYKKKYFFDISQRVLKAAKFLQFFSLKKSRNIYKVYDLFNDSLQDKILADAIILVNWIHGFDSKVLRYRLDKLIKNNLRVGGILVFDMIENNSNYKFNHEVNDLIDENNFDIEIVDGYQFGRKLVYARLIRKI